MTNHFFRIFRRPFAVALCAVASLSLAACGGGVETGASDSRLGSKIPRSEQQAPAGDEVTTPPQKSVGSPSTSDDPVDESPAGNDDPDQGGSDPIVDGSDEPAEENSDPADGEELLPEDPPEEQVSVVNGTVLLEWQRPVERENGEFLEGDDIGGYELRYRELSNEEFETVIIENGWLESYELQDLQGEFEFQIAAFDVNGLYSNFLALEP